MENPRITSALKVASQYGGIDGAHHKEWVIDQMVRVLLGDRYESWVKVHNDGEDGANTYKWPVGVAP